MSTSPRSLLKRLIPAHHTDAGIHWENLARTTVVLCLLIVPLLVLPITNDGWEIHKTIALLALTSLAWIFAWVAVWRRREHTWSWRRVDILVVAWLMALILSAWFSLDTWIGLAGTSGAYAETLPVLVALASWWWLWPQIFRANEPRRLLAFGLGAGVLGAQIFQIVQLFGFPLTPELSSQPLFSLISQSTLDTALLAAVAGTVALAILSRAGERWLRRLAAAGLVISWLVMFFLQQPVGWGAFALGMIGVVVLESRVGRPARAGIVVGAVMLAGLGLVTQVTNLPASSSVPRSVEIRMDAASSWSVTGATLAKHPLIGTGPNTWYQAFTRYRTTEFNSSPWWNIRFIKSQNAWSQWLATFGLVGTTIWAILLFWMARQAWSGWRTRGQTNSLLALFVITVTLLGGFFMTWSLVWWMIVWATLAWLRLEKPIAETRTRPIGPVAMAGAALAVLAVLWFWYPALRIYASEVLVRRAQTAITRIQPLEKVQSILTTALVYNPRNQAAAELLGHAYATQADLTAQSGQTEQAVTYVRSALTSVQPNLLLRENDPAAREYINNLLNRLSPFISDAEEGARQNFSVLRNLEPSSPIHDVGYGQTLLVTRSRILGSEPVTDEIRTQAGTLLNEAKQVFASALRKKPDYLLARLATAQVLNLDNQPAAALTELDRVATDSTNIAFYWRERGVAESKLKNATAAVASFEQALKVDQQDVTSYLAFSQHYQDAGQIDKAKEVLGRGLSVLPGLPVLQQTLDEL